MIQSTSQGQMLPLIVPHFEFVCCFCIRLISLGRNSTKCITSFPVTWPASHRDARLHSSGGSFDHLAKVVSPMFLHCKVTVLLCFLELISLAFLAGQAQVKILNQRPHDDLWGPALPSTPPDGSLCPASQPPFHPVSIPDLSQRLILSFFS